MQKQSDKQPFFSVILPTYNRASYLKEAIESIIAQTFTDWEIIIVDDGSTDGTQEMVNTYLETTNVRYYLQENSGPGSSRNHAVSKAKGLYFAFLDDDDYFLPHHLQTFYDYIIQQQCPKVFIRSFIHWAEDGEIVGSQKIIDKVSKTPQVYMMKQGTAIYPTSSVLHHEIFDHYRFNEDIKVSIDAECWLRVFCKYPLHIIPEITSVVRRHSSNLTLNNLKTYNKYIDTWKRILGYEELRPFLPKRYIRHFIGKYYLYSAYSQLAGGKWKSVLSSLMKSVYFDTSYIVKKETFLILGKALLQKF